MKALLETYKNRLVNLSGRNKSLSLKKLYKKSSFDLFELGNYNKAKAEDIKDFLINRSNTPHEILSNPYAKEKQLNEIIDSLPEANREEFAYKKERSMRNMMSTSQYLKTLNKEISIIEKETGKLELFIGYPFVEGCFKDGTFLRAPIFLFPIKLYCESDVWYIENALEREIVINKVFLFAYSKYNEIKLNDFPEEFENFEDFKEDFISATVSYFEGNGISIAYNKTNSIIDKFENYTKQNTPKYKPSELFVKKNIILGRFPLSNSIYKDYSEMERLEIEHDVLKRLLFNEERKLLEEPAEVKEKEYFFVSPLDYSQEKALQKANISDNLVIYGPPGTGKSQTIANIIADALCKGKKVLMVSQKRAALDVVYNRLSDLNSKIMIIHDSNKDKKSFYQKILLGSSELNNGFSNKEANKIASRASLIDSKIKQLNRIYEKFNEPREFGLTLQKMYEMTKDFSGDKDDPRFYLFNKYRRTEFFGKFKYNEYKTMSANAANIKYIGLFIKMMNTKKQIKNIDNLLESLNNFDLVSLAEDTENVMHEIKRYTDLFENSENYNILVKAYEENNYKIDYTKVTSLADELNMEQNCELLKALNVGNKFSPLFWLSYLKNKKQEEANRNEFENLKSKMQTDFKELNDDILGFFRVTGIVEKYLNDDGKKYLVSTRMKMEQISPYLEDLKKAAAAFSEYKEIKNTLSYLNETEKQMILYAINQEEDISKAAEIIKLIPELAITEEIMKAEAAEPKLIKDYVNFNEITGEIYKAMQTKNNCTVKYLKGSWNERFANNFLVAKEYNEFLRQASKKSKLLSIRSYVEKFTELSINLFPCWLLSPETVSEILPLSRELFDIIIFDEASQMYVENAIPSIYRASKVIIAGDEKQLRPSSAFASKIDDDDEEASMDTIASYEEESLLDLSKVRFDSVLLNYHYRSDNDALINFSNYAFYGGKLSVSPNIYKSNLYSTPIERIKVEGCWIERKNYEEAEAVVNLVQNIFNTRKNNESIGIITFNISQKELIEEMLEGRCLEDDAFKTDYAAECERTSEFEDISIFIKNIENVQGDERDIIIFSTAYAKNPAGKLSVQFGSLSLEGGENRLNVAISRAKKKVYVVTSIEPEELNVEATVNNGPKLLKKYLQYAKYIAENNEEAANDIIYKLPDNQTGVCVSSDKLIAFSGEFQKELYIELKKLGFSVDSQVGVSSYKIDLAIYDEKSCKYILGIECDSSAYKKYPSARERDILRHKYLQSRGWRIIRVWSRDWWKNKQAEVEKIKKLCEVMG